jgi:hypothetical protein
MSKFSLKADHFITPIKLVLPGIIISLIGATAGFYIFNNPTKNKAKATYATWNVLKQFEQIMIDNTDLIPCRADSMDQVVFKKDYIHLLEMTRQNILDLKEEGNVDKRLDAVINLKIDSYNEIKKISEVYLDTFMILKDEINRGLHVPEQQLIITSYYQQKYANEVDHVTSRDTAIINGILNDLTRNYIAYVDSFKIDETTQTAGELQSFIIGKWLTTDKVLIDIKFGGKGIWTQNNVETEFTWKYDNLLLLAGIFSKNTQQPQKSVKMTLQLADRSPFRIEVFKANKNVLGFQFEFKNRFVYAQACRQ